MRKHRVGGRARPCAGSASACRSSHPARRQRNNQRRGLPTAVPQAGTTHLCCPHCCAAAPGAGAAAPLPHVHEPLGDEVVACIAVVHTELLARLPQPLHVLQARQAQQLVSHGREDKGATGCLQARPARLPATAGSGCLPRRQAAAHLHVRQGNWRAFFSIMARRRTSRSTTGSLAVEALIPRSACSCHPLPCAKPNRLINCEACRRNMAVPQVPRLWEVARGQGCGAGPNGGAVAACRRVRCSRLQCRYTSTSLGGLKAKRLAVPRCCPSAALRPTRTEGSARLLNCLACVR